MSALKILTQLILKDTIKQKNLMLEFTGQAKKGIASLENLPVLRRDAESKASKLLVDAKERGMDLSKLSAEQIKKTYNFSKEVRNQKLKNIQSRFFDPSGKMKSEGEDIVKKGLEGLGKKKDPFMGANLKVVPKETVTASPERIKKGFSTQMKLNRPEENEELIKSFMLRENAEFNALSREQQKEIFDMFDAHMRPKKPDMASGGIAGELRLNRPGYDSGIGPVGEGQYSPTKDKAWMQTMPKIDPILRRLIEEYKKRKGLAEILGV